MAVNPRGNSANRGNDPLDDPPNDPLLVETLDPLLVDPLDDPTNDPLRLLGLSGTPVTLALLIMTLPTLPLLATSEVG